MDNNIIGAKSAPVTITDLRINGTTPFCSAGDGPAERLEEAHALLMVVANGYDCAEESGGDAAENFGSLRHEITSKALRGIATLLALAMHHSDVAHSERVAA